MSDWHEAESHVERAHDAYEAGRWAEAERELRRALEIHPDQSEWQFNLGLTLHAAGRLEEAVEAFEAADRLDPGDPHTPLMLGATLVRLGRYGAALDFLGRAASRDPGNAEAYEHQITALTRLGRHDEAEVAFYLGVQAAPDEGALHAAIAESLFDRGLYARAAWCLHEASRLDDGLPGVHARLGTVYAAQGQPELARRHYLAELRRRPGDTETLVELGRLLRRIGRGAEAGEKFRRALELNPAIAEAHFQLAGLAAEAGDHTEARDRLESVLRLAPEYPGVRLAAARSLLATRDGVDADRARSLLVAEFEAFVRDVSTDGVGCGRGDGSAARDGAAVRELISTLVEAKLAARAVAIAEVLASVEPASAGSLHLLGLALYNAGRPEEAVAAWERALESEPGHLATTMSLLAAHGERRRWGACVRVARAGVRANPGQASLRRLLFWARVRVLAEPVLRVARALGLRRAR